MTMPKGIPVPPANPRQPWRGKDLVGVAGMVYQVTQTGQQFMVKNAKTGHIVGGPCKTREAAQAIADRMERTNYTGRKDLR
jgi:hypothetical protein